MKKRQMVPADAYQFAGDAVAFYTEGAPTIMLVFDADSVLAKIQGIEETIPVRGAGLLDKLNWMILGFGPEDRLARLVVELNGIKTSDLDRSLRRLFEARDVPLRRIPPNETQ